MKILIAKSLRLSSTSNTGNLLGKNSIPLDAWIDSTLYLLNSRLDAKFKHFTTEIQSNNVLFNTSSMIGKYVATYQYNLTKDVHFIVLTFAGEPDIVVEGKSPIEVISLLQKKLNS